MQPVHPAEILDLKSYETEREGIRQRPRVGAQEWALTEHRGQRDAAEAHAAATEKMTARERGKIGRGRWHGHSRVMASSRFRRTRAMTVHASPRRAASSPVAVFNCSR